MHDDACTVIANLFRHRCHLACAIPCDQPQLLTRCIPALRSTGALLDMRCELFSTDAYIRARRCLDAVSPEESNRGVLKLTLCKAIVFSYSIFPASDGRSPRFIPRPPAFGRGAFSGPLIFA